MWGNTRFLRLAASRWWCEMNDAVGGESVASVSKRQRRIERRARDVVLWKGIVVPDVAVERTGNWRKVGRVEYGNVDSPFRVEVDGWVVVAVPIGGLVCRDMRRVSSGEMCSCEIIKQGNGLVRVNLWGRSVGYVGVTTTGEIRPVEVSHETA